LSIRTSEQLRIVTRLVLAIMLASIPIISPTSAQETRSQSRQRTLPPQPPDNYSGILVESNEQLFATLCALDAAGFAADESTLAEMPSRLALREDMLKMQGPATEALRQFYRDHLLADPGETLSRYVTFSLVVGPPPHFDFQVNRDLVPPDVIAIDGFREILVAFYQEARLDRRWASVEPEYQRAIAVYQSPVRKIVTTTNAYLREVLKPIYDRTFTVYVEPLVGNRTNFRNSGSHYSIVVGTTSQMPVEQIQHAYLHFMLDPLPLQYRKQIETKRALLPIAASAPLLPEEYRQDFLAFTDECFIKSVELRLRHLSAAQLESALVEADQSGFILVRPFVAQLQKFEKAEPAMSYYFPDLIAAIDVSAQQERLKDVKFSSDSPAPAPKPQRDSAASTFELDQMLATGDHEIATQDTQAAAATFEAILAKYPGEPRAEYGLAIASVMSGNAERAEQLFSKLVEAPAQSAGGAGSPTAAGALDPAIVSWSHVYLGRIHDLEEERDAALIEYRGALSVAGAPEAARVAAQRGLDEPYKSRSRQNATAPGTGNSDGAGTTRGSSNKDDSQKP
jgi:hypothetical protein